MELKQTDCGPLIVGTGNGFTVTGYIVGNNAEQPLDVGMMEKLTMVGIALLLLMIWWISPVPVVWVIVIPGGKTGTVQANVVPGTEDVRRISAWKPEQIDSVEGVAMTSGRGSTVTFLTVGFAARQPFAS